LRQQIHPRNQVGPRWARVSVAHHNGVIRNVQNHVSRMLATLEDDMTVQADSSTPTIRERLLLGGLALVLTCLSSSYAVMGGWSGLPATPTERLISALPVLSLSAVTGLAAVALARLALRRPAWAWYLLVGLVPTAVEVADLLAG
jgi:hypothetical protein